MKKVLVTAVLVFGIAGCGGYSQTVQVNQTAYLLLIGEPAGHVVTIDNGAPVDLAGDTRHFDLNGQKATKIEVPVGAHTLHITKNGTVTVHRKFYVSAGNSFEVRL